MGTVLLARPRVIGPGPVPIEAKRETDPSVYSCDVDDFFVHKVLRNSELVSCIIFPWWYCQSITVTGVIQ